MTKAEFKVGDKVRLKAATDWTYTVTGVCGGRIDLRRDHKSAGASDVAWSTSESLEHIPAVEEKPVSPCPAADEAARRKGQPVARGVLDYFPDALLAVGEVSVIGNRQHNGDNPLHWAYGKSADAADCIIRHLVDRGTLDTDGAPHSAKVAWRALAMLQQELESKNPELHAKRQAMRDLAKEGKR